MKKIILLLLLVMVVTAAAIAYHIQHRVFGPYKGYREPKIAVTIHPGMSVNAIAKILHSKGVIPHPWYLKGIFIYKKTQGQSKAGDYVFDRPMSPWQVYEKLMKGEIQYTVMTVPEGANVFDVENIFEMKGVGRRDDFRIALQSKEVLGSLKAIDPLIESPEGFLFPNTYFLTKREMDARTAILLMMKQFAKIYGAAERKRAAELNLNTLQVITLASLIEKETAQPSERPLIAGVFHNRLKKSMLLQCDPTVIYALAQEDRYSGKLTLADLRFQSPYNTYVSPGLPPGPIANPGYASLVAAVQPASTNYLFFVRTVESRHTFSETLAAHNRAVAAYRKMRRTS